MIRTTWRYYITVGGLVDARLGKGPRALISTGRTACANLGGWQELRAYS